MIQLYYYYQIVLALSFHMLLIVPRKHVPFGIRYAVLFSGCTSTQFVRSFGVTFCCKCQTAKFIKESNGTSLGLVHVCSTHWKLGESTDELENFLRIDRMFLGPGLLNVALKFPSWGIFFPAWTLLMFVLRVGAGAGLGLCGPPMLATVLCGTSHFSLAFRPRG